MEFRPGALILVIGLQAIFLVTGCFEPQPAQEPASSAATLDANAVDEVWQMEEKYWEYVANQDTTAYLALWHTDFMGYPSFGDGVATVAGIAKWIPDLHKDPQRKFSYVLHRRGVNGIDDVVMAFYDADEIWSDPEGREIDRQTYKLTHTWKKQGDTWVILGGMAAKKSQDTLGK